MYLGAWIPESARDGFPGGAATVGRNVRRLRAQAGIPTQTAFARLLRAPQSQVGDWEGDRYSVLEASTLVRIAKALRCSVDDLLAGVDPDYDRVRGVESMPSVIPTVLEGDASPWEDAEKDGSEGRTEPVWWTSRPADVSDPDAYGVWIRGDSMVPAYSPNMIAIVSPRVRLRDGDEVYAGLTSGDWVVRVAHAVPGGHVLEPYNRICPARFVKRRRVRAMHVIVYSRRAVLRRRVGAFVLGDLGIDYEQRRVTMSGRRLELTATEYELLCALSVNAGRVSTYESLLRQVWGRRASTAHVVRNCVVQLRRKLGDDAARPAYVLTERGLGYRMAGSSGDGEAQIPA